LETDSDNTADVSWLVDSDWEVETDSLAENEVRKDSETDAETLADTDWLIDSD
jgi:hypothetical protein